MERTEALDAEIIARYSSGETATSIAATMGFSVSTIHNIIRAGGHTKRKMHKLSDDGGPFVYLSIRSRRIVDMLASRGMCLKRTRKPDIELSRSRHFWRGAIDGDGWFGVSGGLPGVGLSGQRPLLECFCDFVAWNTRSDINPTQRSPEETLHRAQTSGETAAEIVRLLYEDVDDNCALTRKHARAKRIIAGDRTDSQRYNAADDYCTARSEE